MEDPVELSANAEEYHNELRSDEFNAMHFGFSPRGFTDQVHNCFVDAWAHTVENVLLKDPIIRTAENKKQLHEKLMDIIFTSGGGAFQKYLAEFTRYVSRFVFRIPDSVTLPVHHLVQNVNAKELATNEAYNFAQEEKKLRAKEKEIILKKHALAEVKKRCEEADEAIERMKKMLELLEERDA